MSGSALPNSKPTDGFQSSLTESIGSSLLSSRRREFELLGLAFHPNLRPSYDLGTVLEAVKRVALTAEDETPLGSEESASAALIRSASSACADHCKYTIVVVMFA